MSETIQRFNSLGQMRPDGGLVLYVDYEEEIERRKEAYSKLDDVNIKLNEEVAQLKSLMSVQLDLLEQNEKLKAMIESAPVVYGAIERPKDEYHWSTNKIACDTHVARLIMIEEIKTKCEKHQPMAMFDKYGMKIEDALKMKCTICGANIEAIQWKEVK